MQIPPAAVIASWPPPNYENPATRGDALLVVMILFSIFMAAAAGGRFYSRIFMKRWFGWDDVMMVLALIFAIGMNAAVVLANRKYGWNRHIWDLEYNMFQNANIVAFAAKLLFVEAATFTRMSLIFFYYRLVRDTGIAWFSWVLHASMAFVVALGIAFTCIGIWLCIPVQSYWVFPPMADYKCLNEGTATLIVGILNCVADLLTTILPIPLVMRLQMPMKHRIGVSVLLSLGIVVTAAGIIRTYFIWESLINSWDESWLSYPLWICAAVEIDLAVICACAPALKPLLQKPLSRISSRLSSKLTSLRTPSHNTNQTSSSTAAAAPGESTTSTRLPFRKKRHGGDSVWDGDEEYGMLRLASDTDKVGTTICSGPSEEDGTARKRPGGGVLPSHHARKATLEIIKRQSVDQEVSFLGPEGEDLGGEKPGRVGFG